MRRFSRWLWLGLVPAVTALAVVVGCTNDDCHCNGGAGTTTSSASTNDSTEDTNTSSSTGTSGTSYVYAEKADKDDDAWATIKGQIVWGSGDIPEPVEIKPNKDAVPCLAKGKLYEEAFVINKANKGMRWVFVSLKPEGSGTMPIHPKLAKPEKDEVEIDQPCCQFIDHALALRVGQTLVAKNSSPIAHSLRWLGGTGPKGNGEGNVTIPAGGSLKATTMKHASRNAIPVECAIHSWMKAWIWVYDHPYYAVTDANGKFEIKLAPAGKFRLVIWHEAGWGTGGRNGQEITIKGGKDMDLGKIEYKRPD